MILGVTSPSAKASAVSAEHPKEKSLVFTILVILLVVTAVLVLPWVVLRSAHRASSESLVADTLAEREHVAGAKTYARSCASCHEMKGQGRPGRYPSLIGTPWLLDDKETPIRIVLLGVTGPMDVDGEVYDGVMPNLGITLSDRDVAQVLNFARTSFGNDAEPITEEEVAKVRASLGGRQEPWRGGAELIEAKKTPVLP